MSVLLPTGGVQNATPRFLDRGGILQAQLGGPDQRLDRLGSKWGSDFELKPMKADDARIWIARLIRGRREKAIIKFPQPGFAPDFSTNNVKVDGINPANANVINLYVAGTTYVGKSILEGQFISVFAGGSDQPRTIYQATADATWAEGLNSQGIDGSILTLPIQPSLKITHNNGWTVFTSPSDVAIEGYVVGDQSSWTIDNAKIYGLSFSIEEAR